MRDNRAAHSPRRRSLHSYLFLLALAPLLLLIAVTMAFIWTQFKHQRETVINGLRDTARAFALAVDRELDTDRAVLETLSLSPLIDAADWREFHAVCVKIIDKRQDGAIILMDASGQMVLNTGVQFGAPLPRLSRDLVHQTVEWQGRQLPVSNSQMLFLSLASGRPEYGDLYYGRVGKRPAIAIAVPVIRDGKAMYTIAISSTPKAFATLLQQEPNSPDLDMLIIDRAGRIISSDAATDKLIGQLAPGPLNTTPATVLEGAGETIMLNDRPFLYAFSRSSLSGWRVVVATPQDRAIASIRQSLAPWLAVVFITAAAGIILAQSIWRRVATPLKVLTEGAEAIQRGEQRDIPESGIREVDTLSDMLRHASRIEHARHEEVTRRQLAEERERVSAENAEVIRRSEQRYRSLFDNNLDPLFSLNLDGRFTAANMAAEHLCGYTLTELQNMHFLQLCAAGQSDNAAQAFREALRGRRPYFETAIVSKNGRPIDLFVTGTPVIIDDAVVGLSCIGRDITERKRLTAELQRRVEELNEADRRKDEFIAILAHELRNPLAPIRNAVELLRIKGPQDSEIEWCRNVIEHQVAQMARLMDDLLDVSRITRNKLELRQERLALDKVVGDAVETSRPLFHGRLNLTVELPAEPLWLEADPTRLSQVFSNLLNNAAKYTDAGGSIRLHAERDHDQVVITVQDSGIGISADLLPNLFDMFVQGDGAGRSQGGLGVGLTLARDIVRMHGGSIEAQSPGRHQGSKFIVRLPLAEPPADNARMAATYGKETPAATRGKRVLIVEDNNDQAQSLARLLQLMGHETRIAGDGPSALEILGQFAADLALIDVGLPGMSGYDVARSIRSRLEYRHTMLVAQTGWGRDEDRQRAREAGFDHHLVKPIDHQILRKILDGSEELPQARGRAADQQQL